MWPSARLDIFSALPYATRDVCDGLLRGRTESEIVRESSAPAAEVIKRCLTIPRARILAPLFT